MLITDLYDTDLERMLAKLAEMEAGGVVVVVLLALSDDGKPGYSAETAQRLADLGIPAFACTPDAFPELIALAISHGDIRAWGPEERGGRSLRPPNSLTGPFRIDRESLQPGLPGRLLAPHVVGSVGGEQVRPQPSCCRA